MRVDEHAAVLKDYLLEKGWQVHEGPKEVNVRLSGESHVALLLLFKLTRTGMPKLLTRLYVYETFMSVTGAGRKEVQRLLESLVYLVEESRPRP